MRSELPVRLIASTFQNRSIFLVGHWLLMVSTIFRIVQANDELELSQCDEKEGLGVYFTLERDDGVDWSEGK